MRKWTIGALAVLSLIAGTIPASAHGDRTYPVYRCRKDFGPPVGVVRVVVSSNQLATFEAAGFVCHLVP